MPISREKYNFSIKNTLMIFLANSLYKNGVAIFLDEQELDETLIDFQIALYIKMGLQPSYIPKPLILQL